MGRGRWWPASVLSINAVKPYPMIAARFECRSGGKNGIDGPAFVGITTTRMRYLELRDPHLKGDDRPDSAPTAIFAKPEESAIGVGDIQHLETRIADDLKGRIVTPLPVKRSRARKKSRSSNLTQDASAIAAET